MINCKDLTENLDLYLNKKPIKGSSRLGIWMHLLVCKNCRVYAEQIKTVSELGPQVHEQEKKEDACSEEFKNDLVKKYKKTNPGL